MTFWNNNYIIIDGISALTTTTKTLEIDHEKLHKSVLQEKKTPEISTEEKMAEN